MEILYNEFDFEDVLFDCSWTTGLPLKYKSNSPNGTVITIRDLSLARLHTPSIYKYLQEQSYKFSCADLFFLGRGQGGTPSNFDFKGPAKILLISCRPNDIWLPGTSIILNDNDSLSLPVDYFNCQFVGVLRKEENKPDIL